ncbi:sensor histidine kinase [Chryseolinea soli]|uniref:histidine kinase n=1 Tax=Chryseolinea soli TaxID=2321403 RepID=A0A385SVD8_9BACT|nr:ATP-binding protein [Chryseolinea soli]AYB34271.1 ATP-binding protein [Chryseolinea soli]
MIYKRFTFLIVLRIAFLLGNVLLLSWIFGDPRLFFNQIILFLLLVAQVVELIRYVNHTNRELSRFFLAIKHADFSVTFKQGPLGSSFRELQQSMAEIVDAYKQVKIEKEAQYHFLQLLVAQLKVGIISLEHDEVTLVNPTAERLLGLTGLKHWKAISMLHPKLTSDIEALGDAGRKLVEVRTAAENKLLAVDVSTLVILNTPLKLITLQDINSEIEQKEIEAWHKLIRILTHEIMNSVTPIASLTETMQSLLTDKSGQPKSVDHITPETLGDILFSLATIHKRSDGLLEFVENYRQLTRVPKPVMATVNVGEFLQTIEKLMKPNLVRQDIALSLAVVPDTLQASFDATLLEQVLINLVTNSTHALEGRAAKRIDLRAFRIESYLRLEVTDNGKGIPEKELQEIFVPFFSTKKEGSGIGLSLSKQIVSLHGGTLKVASTPGEGTTFYIQLPAKL